MYYYPLIRVGRMCSSVAIYPQNPLLAVSISEVLSVGLPLLNNKNYSIIDIIDCSKDKYLDTQQGTILFIIKKKERKDNQTTIIIIILMI